MHTDPHPTVPGESGSFLSQPWHRFIGETLLDFRVMGILGQGGMGVVFNANQESLDRQVAIKVLQSAGTSSQPMNQLLEEARCLARMQHPHLVTVHQVGEDKGLIFLVMEYLKGNTLHSLIEAARSSRSKSGKTIPLTETLNMIRQIAEALDYAHARHIVHCDVKPANVMVGEDGFVKVMDFGLAKLMSLNRGLSSERILGTPLYMSPEQTQGRDLDKRSDIFSLGVVLYEMLTSQCPFHGATPQALAQAINTRLPGPPSRLNREVPPDLDAMVFLMLEKQREDRYRSMGAFIKDLDRLRASRETDAYKRVSGYHLHTQSRQGTTPVYRLRPRTPGRRRLKLAVFCGLIVCAVLSLAYFLWPLHGGWDRLHHASREFRNPARELQLAKNYLANGRHDLARPLLLKIIEDQGGTVEAEQARTLLSQWEGNP